MIAARGLSEYKTLKLWNSHLILKGAWCKIAYDTRIDNPVVSTVLCDERCLVQNCIDTWMDNPVIVSFQKVALVHEIHWSDDGFGYYHLKHIHTRYLWSQAVADRLHFQFSFPTMCSRVKCSQKNPGAIQTCHMGLEEFVPPIITSISDLLFFWNRLPCSTKISSIAWIIYSSAILLFYIH